MALAEHEISQTITVRLTEAQAAKLHQAAEAQGQSAEDFIISASVRAADAPHANSVLPAGRASLDSLFRLLEFEPELDALMEHIHEGQRKGIEQFRAEEAAEEAAEQAKAQQ